MIARRTLANPLGSYLKGTPKSHTKANQIEDSSKINPQHNTIWHKSYRKTDRPFLAMGRDTENSRRLRGRNSEKKRSVNSLRVCLNIFYPRHGEKKTRINFHIIVFYVFKLYLYFQIQINSRNAWKMSLESCPKMVRKVLKFSKCCKFDGERGHKATPKTCETRH